LNNLLLATGFEQKIGGRFAPLLTIIDTDDELYELLRDATNETTKKVVGYRKRKSVENLEDQHRNNDFYLFNTARFLEGKQKKSLSVVKNDIGEKVVHPKEVLDL